MNAELEMVDAARIASTRADRTVVRAQIAITSQKRTGKVV